MLVPTVDERGEVIPMVGSPIKMSRGEPLHQAGEELAVSSPGQHTTELLRNELGLLGRRSYVATEAEGLSGHRLHMQRVLALLVEVPIIRTWKPSRHPARQGDRMAVEHSWKFHDAVTI